ncbi:hypothetical protein [Brachyspira sp.]|uniref:hypothetical protein n=1 Tax=Brachyspira sp. TaxID=1977261 RepID=UPI003D7DA945
MKKILILIFIFNSLIFAESKEIAKQWKQDNIIYVFTSDEDTLVVLADGIRYLLKLNAQYPVFWQCEISKYIIKNNNRIYKPIYIMGVREESEANTTGSSLSVYYVNKKIATKYEEDGKAYDVNFDKAINYFIDKFNPYIEAINKSGFSEEELNYYNELIEKYNEFLLKYKK